MDERQRGFVARVQEIAVVRRELARENHALVDKRAGRHRNRVVFGDFPVTERIDLVGDDLAHNVEPALEFILAGEARRTADENLLHDRLDRPHAFAESRIVDRHVAPAEHGQTFGRDDVFDDLPHLPARLGGARHEELTDRVVARLGEGEAELCALRREKLMGDLRQNSAAVAKRRIGADSAAMVEIDQDLQPLFEDVVRLEVPHVGHEADAAGIVLIARVVEAFGARGQRVGAAKERARPTRAGARLVGGPLGSRAHLSAPPRRRDPQAAAIQIF